MNRRSPRSVTRGAICLGVVALGLLATAAPAWADTSTATATAAELRVLALPAVSSGQVAASNDGVQESIVGSTNPALSLLGAQSVIGAGVLVQQARAFDNGTSAACAGLIGAGGSIDINADGTCSASNLPSGGVRLVLGTAVLVADAILGQCVATSTGTPTGRATLVGAQLLGAGGIPVPLDPGPNTGITIPGVASLELNVQAGNSSSLTVTALSLELLTLLGPPLVDLDLGTVTCGPNIRTVGVPAIAPELIPVGLGAAAVGTVTVALRRRQRSLRGGPTAA